MSAKKPIKTREFIERFSSWPDGRYVLLAYGRKAKVVIIKNLKKGEDPDKEESVRPSGVAEPETHLRITNINPGDGKPGSGSIEVEQVTESKAARIEPEARLEHGLKHEYPLPPAGFGRLRLEARMRWVKDNWPELLQGDDMDEYRVQERLEECGVT